MSLEQTMKNIKDNCDRYVGTPVKTTIKEYEVTVGYQGYVRGTKTYLVEASSLEEAEANYRGSYVVEDNIIRDDTEVTDVEGVEC